MRGTLFWLLGTLIAFVATAGAFLLLASLATRSWGPGGGPPGGEILRGEGPRNALVLDLAEEDLQTLKPAPDQSLTVNVRNAGREDLSGVSLRLAVAPTGSPAGREPRDYRGEIENLSPGESAAIDFRFDLSPTDPSATAGGPEESHAFLEARATSRDAPPDVKTAVLAP